MPAGISNASSAVGNVSVLNGNLAAGKTILFNGASVSGATATLRTVTAGKTYYLLYANLSVKSSDNFETASIKFDTDYLILKYTAVTAIYNENFASTTSKTFPHPIPIAAGTVITVVSSAGGTTASAQIIGWEE